MKSAPKQPTPADPGRTAATQAGLNLNTAIGQSIMNNVDQITPYGNLTYTSQNQKVWQPKQYDDKGNVIAGTGTFIDVPKWTATQNLSPDGQRLFDTNKQTTQNLADIGRDQSARIGDMMKDPLNYDGIVGRAGAIQGPALRGSASVAGPSLRGGVRTDFSRDRQRVENALMGRLNPTLTRQREDKAASLMARGIREGSAAWNAAMGDVSQSENDARLAAIAQAGGEQSRLFDMASRNNQMFDTAEMSRYGARLTGANMDNQNAMTQYGVRTNNADRQNADRAAGIQERTALRQQPFNEVLALMSGSQLQNPNFVNTPSTGLAGVDYSGLVGNRDQLNQRNYEIGVQQRNQMMGGLFGLLSAPFMYSDRRLKRDIERIGSYPSGLAKYRYRYLWSDIWHIGVMADEAPADAVRADENGFLMVDYGRVA